MTRLRSIDRAPIGAPSIVRRSSFIHPNRRRKLWPRKSRLRKRTAFRSQSRPRLFPPSPSIRRRTITSSIWKNEARPAATLSSSFNRRLLRSEEKQQDESAQIIRNASLQPAAHELQDQAKHGERLAQCVGRDVARSPLIQTQRLIRLRRQARFCPEYQRSPHDKDDSYDRHAQRSKQVTHGRVQGSSDRWCQLSYC